MEFLQVKNNRLMFYFHVREFYLDNLCFLCSLPQINLEKQILQKYRQPTILENSRLGFIESDHEN